jgi:AcrR family transcriptional regulator
MCSDALYSSLRMQPVDIAQRGRRPVDKSTASPSARGSQAWWWLPKSSMGWGPALGLGTPSGAGGPGGKAQLRVAGVVRVVEPTVQGGVTRFPSLVVAPQVVDGLGASTRVGSRGFATSRSPRFLGPANAECTRSKRELVAVAQGYGAKSQGSVGRQAQDVEMRPSDLLSEHSLIHTVRVMRAKPMSPEDRRQSIISATTDLVLEHGPEASTRQIADACGIAEGTLFRVFESKDDILAAVVEQLLDPRFVIDEIAALPPTDHAAEAVRALAAVVEGSTTRIRTVMMALHTAHNDPDRRGNHGPRDKTKFFDDQAAIGQAMARVLSAHEGELRVDPQTAATFIRTTVFAGNLPAVPKLSDPHVFTDLLVHALVKEPPCSITQ